jgi:hypothetical protein
MGKVYSLGEAVSMNKMTPVFTLVKISSTMLYGRPFLALISSSSSSFSTITIASSRGCSYSCITLATACLHPWKKLILLLGRIIPVIIIVLGSCSCRRMEVQSSLFITSGVEVIFVIKCSSRA